MLNCEFFDVDGKWQWLSRDVLVPRTPLVWCKILHLHHFHLLHPSQDTSTSKMWEDVPVFSWLIHEHWKSNISWVCTTDSHVSHRDTEDCHCLRCEFLGCWNNRILTVPNAIHVISTLNICRFLNFMRFQFWDFQLFCAICSVHFPRIWLDDNRNYAHNAVH